jgi:hypothetical protein
MSIQEIQTHTVPFLAVMFACSEQEAWDKEITWQTYDDSGLQREGLAQLRHGRLSKMASELVALNDQGAAICMCVNQMDGFGRKKSNIMALCGLFADLDEKLATTAINLNQISPRPNIVVWSGYGCHPRWLFDVPLDCYGDPNLIAKYEEKLRQTQRGLAHFGADKAVCDGTRALRAPGSRNRKHGNSILVTFDILKSNRYSIPDIFPEASPDFRFALPPKPTPPTPNIANTGLAHRRARAYLACIDGAVQGTGGSTHTFNTALKLISLFGLSDEVVYDLLLSDFNSRCLPPWEPEDLWRKVREARKHAEDRLLDSKPATPSKKR